jgi:uncharacterized protein YjbI with pentapeptide repeats
LVHANLINADLRGASLKQANLSNADLTQANLSDADLELAVLYNTILEATTPNTTRFLRPQAELVSQPNFVQQRIQIA